MNETHIEPTISEATTLRELNIHIGFMREKMNTNNEERKVDMAEIKGRLKDLADNQVTRQEFEELKVQVVEARTIITSLVESRDTLQGKLWGIGIGSGVIVGLIVFIANHFIK